MEQFGKKFLGDNPIPGIQQSLDMITPKLFVKHISPSPKMRSVIDYVWPLRVWERIWCGFSQIDSTKVTWLLLLPLSTLWAERNQVSRWRDNPACLTFLLICEHKGLLPSTSLFYFCSGADQTQAGTCRASPTPSMRYVPTPWFRLLWGSWWFHSIYLRNEGLGAETDASLAHSQSGIQTVPWLRLRAFLLSLFSYVKVPTHPLWQKVTVILAAWEPETGDSQVLGQARKTW